MMAGHGNSRQLNPTLDAQNPPPQHPQNIIKRISSSLSTIRQALVPHRLLNKHPPSTRPQTAPAAIIPLRPDHHRTPCTQPSLTTEPPSIPLFSETKPEDPCPYESNRYHSFPNIEEPKCNFCGLRYLSGRRTTTLTWTTSRPCSPCRSGSSASHLTRGRAEDGNGTRRRSGLEHRRRTSRHIGIAVTTDDGAVVGSGGMQRRAEDGGVSSHPRTQIAGELYPSQDTRQLARRAVSAPFIADSRPQSPALHYLPLPHFKDYPYVHKHEVGPHIEALRAGSQSPLRISPDQGCRTSEQRHGRDKDVIDYSETVYYGHGGTKRITERIVRPTSGGKGRMRNNVLVIASYNSEIGVAHGGDGDHEGRVMEVEDYGPHFEDHVPRSRSGKRGAVEGADMQDDQIVGGIRLELKGGSKCEVLRLRGGDDAKKEQESRGFGSCTWVPFDPHSQWSRMAVTEAILRARTISLNRLAHRRRECSRASHLLMSSTRYECIHPPSHQANSSHVPGLRGGADSLLLFTSSSKDRLPPILLWLAGDKSRSITVAGWRRSKTKKRIDGLIGMAIFGGRAGIVYSGIEDFGKSEVGAAVTDSPEAIQQSRMSVKLPKSHFSTSEPGSKQSFM
ncbi:hypothetical protein J1614_003025 [Plenodomus biglobosus]|nr:hypothetical protein J1614_003025 [Plenodomus biglobosus]